MWAKLYRHVFCIRYTWLSLVLFIVLIGNALHQNWVADFWEHAAAIQTLTKAPFSPDHPLYEGLQGPYQYFSPYSLVLAAIARLTAISSVDVLTIFGPINMFVFIISFYYFVNSLYGDARVAFYTLLFTLFLWGSEAWVWSGFFHVGAVGLVQSYPSTTATALAFLSFAFVTRFLKTRRVSWIIPVPFILWYTILVHTTTALAAYGGILALCISDYKTLFSNRVWLILLAAVSVPIVTSIVWPYFNIAILTFGVPTQYHDSASAMYDAPLGRIGVALLGVPALAAIYWKRPRDPIALMFLIYLAIYVIGGITAEWSMGRVMPFLVLTLHIGIARWAVRAEDVVGQLVSNRPAYVYKSFIAIITVCITIGLVLHQSDQTKRFVRSALPSNPRPNMRYDFLRQHVKENDVVLAKLWTGYIVPAYTGKIVATWGAEPFVDSHERRKRDVATFFSDSTDIGTREQIMQTYGVDFILIDTTKKAEAALDVDLTHFGPIVDRNEGLILIRRE